MKVSVSIQEQNTPGVHNAVLGTFFNVVLHCERHVKLPPRLSLSFQTSKNAKVQAELEILKDCFPSVVYCTPASNHFIMDA